MIHPATQSLYAYWNEVRGERLAPRRLEIQPARIAEHLLDAFILERTGRSAFRFRLAGTRVAGRFGIDLSAQDFLSCWGEGDRSMLEHHLSGIADLGRVGLFTGEAVVSPKLGERVAREPYEFELLVLPLMHTGQSIDRLLCHLVPLEAPEAHRNGPIRGLRLMAAETVWPNGAPEEAVNFSDRQEPLNPQVRMARIVRQGRRQFRVYEGGLGGAREDKSGAL